MKLHNTLTRTVEEFIPLDADNVRMYSCGPTVYDHIHIGNLSAFIAADTLRRTLIASGYQTEHVMNFTDVDDKTIHRSQEQYPDKEAHQALTMLTEHYGQLFLKDMELVGNDIGAYRFVKATDAKVIAGMQDMIRDLHRNGFAYIADDGIYFSIDAYKKSGKTYGQLSDISSSSTSEARIQNDEYDKESAHDFALWKKQKAGEPAWDFELNGHDMLGRPGWHIECSVMSAQNVGQPFDIHTGGIDLIFPHHENEIAQSTADKADAAYAKYFVHNEHILVDGKKMSKSLNNFYTLADISAKGYDPLAFRLLVLQSHYRSQTHFSWENLEAAQNRLHGLREFAVLRYQTVPYDEGHHPMQTDELETAKTMMLEALQDDLSTQRALYELNEIAEQAVLRNVDSHAKPDLEAFIRFIDDTLGLRLSAVPDIDGGSKRRITEREAARHDQNWQAADRLRDQLSESGIGLRDTAHGAIWYWL